MKEQNGMAALSEKELNILKLLARGSRTSEIAKQLRLDFRTVSDISRELKKKYSVDSISGLVAVARQARIID